MYVFCIFFQKVNFLSSFTFDSKISVCILNICLQLLYDLITVFTLSYLKQQQKVREKFLVNKNNNEEEKLCRLISFETSTSNKKIPDSRET